MQEYNKLVLLGNIYLYTLNPKPEEFRLPTHKISFEKAITSLINLSEKALSTFMFRLVFALPFSHFLTLKFYVTLREKAELAKAV